MADIVDLSDESPPRAAVPRPPSTEELKAALEAQLAGRDLAGLSLKALRRELEQRLGVGEAGLDNRKDELKAFAQAYAQAQAARNAAAAADDSAPLATPAAAAAPIEVQMPAAKRRKSLLTGGGGGGDAGSSAAGQLGGVGQVPAPSGGGASVEAPPAKRKSAASAYILWTSDNRARVTADATAAKGGAKPSLSDVCKALGEAWKQVSPEERAKYEQKAAAAKLEGSRGEAQVSKQPRQAKAPKDPKEPKAGKGKGRGKGKSRSSAMETEMSGTLTRVEFLNAAVRLRCQVGMDGTDGPPPPALESFSLAPRLFKSGSAGWFAAAEIMVPMGGKEIKVKAQLNVMVSGSKHWQDGEGLETLGAAAADGDPPAADADDAADAGEASSLPAASAASGAGESAGAGRRGVRGQLELAAGPDVAGDAAAALSGTASAVAVAPAAAASASSAPAGAGDDAAGGGEEAALASAGEKCTGDDVGQAVNAQAAASASAMESGLDNPAAHAGA